MAAVACASGKGTVGCGFAVPRRESWADIQASDNETEDEIVAQNVCHKAPVLNSSQKEPQNGSSSKESSLLLRDLKLLRGSSEVDTEAGTSGRSDSGSEAVAEEAEVGGWESTTSWEPNVAAPDFLPTQSMNCQLVGFSQVASEKATLPARKSEASPAVGCMNFRAAGMLGGNRGSFAEEAVPAVPQGDIPEATEEEWERRRDSRILCIKIRQDTPEYVAYLEGLKKNSQADELITPDPADRSISKRKWKYLIQQWSDAFSGVTRSRV